MDMWAWRSSGDVDNMWDYTASCIRKAAREELGVTVVVTEGIGGGMMKSKSNWVLRQTTMSNQSFTKLSAKFYGPIRLFKGWGS